MPTDIVNNAFNPARAEEVEQIMGGPTKNVNTSVPRGVFATGTTHATPGTEVGIAHTLGTVPVGVIACADGQDKAGSIYKGATANTASLVYVKSDIASVAVKLFVF